MRVDATLGSLTSSTSAFDARSSATAKDLNRATDTLRAARDGSMEADEVGQQFEKLFSTMLVREMRKSISSVNPEGGLFGKGAGSDVYAGWFDEHVGAALAERNTLGLTGMVKANVARLQVQADRQETGTSSPAGE